MERIKNAHRPRQSHSVHSYKKLSRIIARRQHDILVGINGLIALVLPMIAGLDADPTSTMLTAFGGILLGAAISGAFDRD